MSIFEKRKKIIFRPQRRDLIEAMTEVKVFKNEKEMKRYIVNLWHKSWGGSEKLFTVRDIVINKASPVNDKRIGWEDSMNIGIKRLGSKEYNPPLCIGMCATKFK